MFCYPPLLPACQHGCCISSCCRIASCGVMHSLGACVDNCKLISRLSCGLWKSCGNPLYNVSIIHNPQGFGMGVWIIHKLCNGFSTVIHRVINNRFSHVGILLAVWEDSDAFIPPLDAFGGFVCATMNGELCT